MTVKVMLSTGLIKVTVVCRHYGFYSAIGSASFGQKRLDKITELVIFIFTARRGGLRVPRAKTNPDKQSALRQHGTLNPRPHDVRHPLFQNSDFFDPDDMVQVKYEMIRQVHVDNRPVSQAAHDFGFSRPSFYQAKSTFEQAGLSGLVPLKRGPRSGHKLTAEVMEFLAAKRTAEPSLNFAQLADLVKKDFHVQVHPRSIERQLLREKKRR